MTKLTDGNRKWWTLVVMTGTLSMILIDSTVVSVALPTIQRDLDMTTTELQWIVNAYLLALAAFVAVGGRVADILGNKQVFLFGVVVFTISSATAGLAEQDWHMLVSRAVQGLGAAAMIPPSQAIVTNAFDASERGKAFGIYAGISMVFLALGPLVGGLLTEGVTWRAVFFVNLPVGVLLVIGAAAVVPRTPPQRDAVMDWLGATLLVAALVALILPLMQAENWGWTNPLTLGLFALAAVLLVLFVLLEPRVKEALIQLRLFANRNFSVDNFVLFCVQFALMGLTVFGAIWIQNILRFSPIEAGLALLPLTIPLVIAAPIVGRAFDRVGPRFLVGTGAALVAVGIGSNALLLPQETYAYLVPGYVIEGIGIAMIMTPASTDAMNATPAMQRSAASGLMQTMRQVGGTLGLAVMGSVLATVQSDKIVGFIERDANASPEQAEAIAGVLSESEATQHATTQHVSPGVLEAAADALTSGTQAAYFVACGVVALASFAAIVLLRRQRAIDAGPTPAERGEAAAAPPAV
jgi:EmrB/QacA subfamily drug resistance transporter